MRAMTGRNLSCAALLAVLILAASPLHAAYDGEKQALVPALSVATRGDFASACAATTTGYGAMAQARGTSEWTVTSRDQAGATLVTVDFVMSSMLTPVNRARPLATFDARLVNGDVVEQTVSLNVALPPGSPLSQLETMWPKETALIYYLGRKLQAVQNASRPYGMERYLAGMMPLIRRSGGTIQTVEDKETVAGMTVMNGRPALILDALVIATMRADGKEARFIVDGYRLIDPESGLLRRAEQQIGIQIDNVTAGFMIEDTNCTITRRAPAR